MAMTTTTTPTMALAYLAVATILLLSLAQCTSAKGVQRAPALEAFATYEDMQRYFANRNLRSLRYIENPTDDSYINAFNQHNEQSSPQRIGKRHKRSTAQRKLPNEPTLVKFEIADAVEPSAEVKELIRQHRSRDLKQLENAKIQADIRNTTPSAVSRKQESPKTRIKKDPKAKKQTKRNKRAANRQPANFQVKMIPFDATDAREPDAQTKMLIKRMRAMELEKLSTAATSTDQHINPNLQTAPVLSNNLRSKYGKRIYRRSRRSAPQTPPQMIKFELEDAKEPNEAIKNHMKQKHPSRESKAIKELSILSPQSNVTQAAADRSDMDISNDQSSHESRRYYVYKDVPVKSKKSVNSLPHEVQHVISHLMKENHGGKAYVKYIPAQQVDYGRLKSYYSTKLAAPAFGAKLQPAAATYVKYVQQPAQKQPEQLVQIHTVPVVEKIRYVYTPVAVASAGDGGHSGHSGHGGQAAQAHSHAYLPHNYVPAAAPAAHSAAISHPIVVHDAAAEEHASHQQQQQQQLQHQQQAAEVHHTYTADLSHVHHSSAEVEGSAQAIKDIPAPHFRASKPDPLLALDDNKFAEGDGGGGISEQYKYEVYAAPHASAAQHQQQEYVPSYAKQEAAAAPVIKIEYHAAPDALKENYKELHEFKELSALMGKSPEDQIHGLTYLLAKEMQTKLQSQRQHKQLDEQEGLQQHQRPQDNTAPILFHPEDAHHHQQLLQQQQQHQPVVVAVDHASSIGVQKKFIGMAKTKQYIPIVEGISSAAGGSGEQKLSVEQLPRSVQHFAAKLEPQAPHPSSFIEYGLSPNYEGLKGQLQQKKVLVEQVIHHPTLTHHADLVGVGAHHGLQAAAPEHSAGGSAEHAGAGGADLHDSHDLQYASKYAFGYRIRDFHTGNDFGHKQNRDLNGVTRGQYHILLPDGRIQNVIYHADDTGFHADVSFESGR